MTPQWCINSTGSGKPQPLDLTTVEERTFIRGGGGQLVSCVASAKVSKGKGGGQLLHLTAETPGDTASIVPNASPTDTEIAVQTAAAPANSEFMDGDAFIFLSEDDLCVCATSFHDSTIRWCLAEMFKKAKLGTPSTQFDLQKVADMTRVKLLRRSGVKEIFMRATVFEATAAYAQRKDHTIGLLSSTGRAIKGFFGKPNDVTDDSLSVELVIKKDKRHTKNLSLGEKRIDELAIDLVKNQQAGDDFLIVTERGERISPDEIYMTAKRPLKKKGKSVERDSAWDELQKFYARLLDSGVVEE